MTLKYLTIKEAVIYTKIPDCKLRDAIDQNKLAAKNTMRGMGKKRGSAAPPITISIDDLDNYMRLVNTR